MAERKICTMCYGNCKIMGGGMMQIDCPRCKGEGKIYEEIIVDERDIVIDKRSKSYRDAIKDIKALHDGMTDDEAKDMFEKQLKEI